MSLRAAPAWSAQRWKSWLNGYSIGFVLRNEGDVILYVSLSISLTLQVALPNIITRSVRRSAASFKRRSVYQTQPTRRPSSLDFRHRSTA